MVMLASGFEGKSVVDLVVGRDATAASRRGSAGRHIVGFDGIRGLAVIAVVLTHLGVYGQLQTAGALPPGLFAIVHGGTGVFAFFVLSGFLITTLLLLEQKETGTISLKNFYMRRALRIFPLYFLVVGIALVLTLTGNADIHWASFPFALTYTYNFVPVRVYSGLLGHTWTLAVEEHFYLLWPALFLLLAVRSRLLLSLAAGAFLLSLALRIAFAQTTLVDHFFPERWTPVAGGSIALGAAMALLINSPNQTTPWRQAVGHPAAALVGAAMLAHSLAVDLEPWLLALHVRTLGIGILVGWIYLNQASWLARALDFAPLRYIGLISYGIYMWQGLLLGTGPTNGTTLWPPNTWVALAMLVIIAPASYALFEKRLLKLKRKYRAIRTDHD